CSPAFADHPPLALPGATISAEQEENAGLQLDETADTGSRLGLSLRENPASVSVADRARIERLGARDFQDVANALPGVNASAPPGWGGYVAYRGFNGAQVNQLFNGISLQYSSANRPVNAWIYDRVELIGGPSSFAHGSGSVGGTLNYVTKLASREESAGEARISYARFDTQQTAIGYNQALNEGPGPRHYERVDFSRDSSNGYIDRQQRGANNLAFSLLSDLTPDLSHTLAIEYLEEKEDSPYWGTPTLNPKAGELKIDRHNRFDNYNVEDGRYEQRTRWLRSITDYRLDEQTSLRNTFYHYEGQRDYRNLEVYAYNADNSLINRSGAYLQRHDQELNGNRLELLRQAHLFGLASDWALGADYSVNRQSVYPRSGGAFDSIDPDAFDPDRFDDIPGMSAAARKSRSNEIKTRSAFVENRQALSERLALVTALRYDHIDFSVTDHLNEVQVDRRWDALTGRAGLVFDLSDDANLYVQYSTSAEPPGGTLTGASATQVRDFDLSTGRQIEVGSKLEFLDGRASATVAAYRIVRKDFPVTDPNNANATIQAGQQTSDGVELAGSFKVTERLLAEANVAWVDARYDDFNEVAGGVSVSRKGKTPVNIPERVGNLWLTYDFDPRWQGGVDARYVASVYANNANTMWVPSYTLFGAFVKYRVDEHTDLTARLRNLTDEVYARFIHQSNSQYYVGEPRSLELSLNTRF
ncbi:TonB-dependent receptor, partial [Pseudomonas sp.]|uniref:TonB-dependent receptor n=1 Tax=Pseudomonas sp. TaxID=306 RepID=UPI0028AEE517